MKTLEIAIVDKNAEEHPLLNVFNKSKGDLSFEVRCLQTLPGRPGEKALKVDAVLLNTAMLDLKSAAPLAEVRRLFPGAAIIAFHGKNNEDEAAHTLLMGAQDYFNETALTGDQLCRMVHRAVLRERSAKKAWRRSHHDSLTQLPARPLFGELLTHAINQSRRQDRILALLSIGLRLPRGRKRGSSKSAAERLLGVAARRIRDTLRESDIAARVGPNEMAVAFTGLTSPGDAERATQRLHNALLKPISVDGKSTSPDVHTGISLYPMDGADVEKLMADAAAARKSVKKDIQAGYHFASPDIKASAVDRMALEESLARAIREKELVLYYQPQFDLFTGKVVGLETLVHWRHPELGLLPAQHWIPLAEDFGRGVDIGSFVLRAATRQYRRWLSQGCEPIELSLNTATSQFLDPKFPKIVSEALADSEIDPRLVVLEFPEDSIVRHADVAFRALTRLSELGVRVANDNFGLGYASLNQLTIYPFHGLKIDRSLIVNMAKGAQEKIILKAIIAMAHEMGLTVTAVGVESDAQEKVLKKAKCDRVQGFLLGRPMPAQKVMSLLNREG